MNLTEPLRSVIPGAHGQVLQVVARTQKPLTARQVALLTEGGTSKRRANDVLQELTEAGVILRQDSAPSYLYSLNRDHVAAGAILALADLRSTLLDRIRGNIATWEWKPVAAYLFGSTAKGTAAERSDIDVLVVQPPNIPADDWDDQLSILSENVHRWSGNYCEILELTEAELQESVSADNPLAADLQDHGVILYGGKKAQDLLRVHRVTASRGILPFPVPSAPAGSHGSSE